MDFFLNDWLMRGSSSSSPSSSSSSASSSAAHRDVGSQYTETRCSVNHRIRPRSICVVIVAVVACCCLLVCLCVSVCVCVFLLCIVCCLLSVVCCVLFHVCCLLCTNQPRARKPRIIDQRPHKSHHTAHTTYHTTHQTTHTAHRRLALLRPLPHCHGGDAPAAARAACTAALAPTAACLTSTGISRGNEATNRHSGPPGHDSRLVPAGSRSAW